MDVIDCDRPSSMLMGCYFVKRFKRFDATISSWTCEQWTATRSGLQFFHNYIHDLRMKVTIDPFILNIENGTRNEYSNSNNDTDHFEPMFYWNNLFCSEICPNIIVWKTFALVRSSFLLLLLASSFPSNVVACTNGIEYIIIEVLACIRMIWFAFIAVILHSYMKFIYKLNGHERIEVKWESQED